MHRTRCPIGDRRSPLLTGHPFVSGRSPVRSRPGHQRFGASLARKPPSNGSAGVQAVPPSGHQIDVGPRLEERIGRRFDFVYSRDRIEDDVLLLAGFVYGDDLRDGI